MLYSPVRYSVYHSVLPLHGIVVQLACVTHAASVHPEPGSNSQLIDLLGLIAKLTIPLRTQTSKGIAQYFLFPLWLACKFVNMLRSKSSLNPCNKRLPKEANRRAPNNKGNYTAFYLPVKYKNKIPRRPLIPINNISKTEYNSSLKPRHLPTKPRRRRLHQLFPNSRTPDPAVRHRPEEPGAAPRRSRRRPAYPHGPGGIEPP